MPKFRCLPPSGLLLMAGMLMTFPNTAVMAENVSHAPEILQYVKEDKVYLLEKIRNRITKPSEKLLVEALLTEDAPQAAALYRKQLDKHPDPLLDPISRARLNAYQQAVGTSAGLPVMPLKGSAAPKPVVKAETPPEQPTGNAIPAAPAPVQPVQPQPVAPAEQVSLFTLQFGSFDNVTNADQLAAQLAPGVQASVQMINGIYKVRLNRTFSSHQEAAAFGRTLPIESIVVPAQP
ncbi:MAG: SPOR domain-containing protein [Chlorobiaceae bacterium]|nr:SPOR domain-containing protein [Chlorobiaceae bacterium]